MFVTQCELKIVRLFYEATDASSSVLKNAFSTKVIGGRHRSAVHYILAAHCEGCRFGAAAQIIDKNIVYQSASSYIALCATT